MKIPDTTILCAVCEGTKVGKHGQECGACFGNGLSTSPWDQRRNGTTVTAWDSEALPPILVDPNTTVHSRTRTARLVGSGAMKYSQGGTIILVSWANREYRGN